MNSRSKALSFPILLTGTIRPTGITVSEERVEERKNEYVTAIKRYIIETDFDPIVFIENSGYPFPAEKVEKLAAAHRKHFEFIHGTLCGEEVAMHGKGYGDGLLIYEGLSKSRLLRSCDIFYKVTGRMFIENSREILKDTKRHRNRFITYDGMGWCMTWFFQSNRSDYLSALKDVYLDCDDRSRRDLEICFWLRLKRSGLDIGGFNVYPDNKTKMGDSNTLYIKSRREYVMRNIAVKLGFFTMSSASSRVFWNVYGKITGRKPYVTIKDIR